MALPDGYHLGIDFGTSNTVAVLASPDGRRSVLLFDGSPMLPSAVCLDATGTLLTGQDAIHAARIHPTGFEPNPKRHIDDGSVLLGTSEVPVTELIRAVLSRVHAEARRVAAAPIAQATLTYPASWAQPRRAVLAGAATPAGLPSARLVAEPVAAAQFFLSTGRAPIPVGGSAVVYDLGGGTFDASVVRRTAAGFEVLATEGLSQAGGLDIDAAVFDYLRNVYQERDPDSWQRLSRPTSAIDRRASRQLWDDVRSAKETLSRNSTTAIHLPLVEQDAPLGREQLEALARPILGATVTTTRVAVGSAALAPGDLAAIFLVGGGSRIPLAATLLQQAFTMPPLAIEQPELVVAQGSLAPQQPVPPVATHPNSARPSDRPYSRPPVSPGFPPAPQSGPPAYQPAAGVPTRAPSMAGQVGHPMPAAHAQPMGVPPAPVWAAPRVVLAAPHQVVVGRPAQPRVAPAQPAKRRRFPIWARLLVIFALLGGGGYLAWVKTRPDPATQVTHVDLKGFHVLVFTMAVSPDGTTVAGVDGDYTIVLWSVSTQKIVRHITTYGGPINRLAFSPDGTVLVAGQDLAMQFFDVATGQQLHGVLGTGGSVESLAFRPDGMVLAISALYRPQVWNVATSEMVLSGPDDFGVEVEQLVYTPDSTLLVAARNVFDRKAGRDVAVVSLLDPATLKPVGTDMPGHTDRIRALAITPDGQTVITGSDDNSLRVWSLRDHKQIGAVLSTNAPQVAGIAVSPDGRLVAVSMSGRVRIWALDTRKIVADLPFNGLGPLPVGWAPDSRTLVSGGQDMVRIWTLPPRPAASPGVGTTKPG